MTKTKTNTASTTATKYQMTIGKHIKVDITADQMTAIIAFVENGTPLPAETPATASQPVAKKTTAHKDILEVEGKYVRSIPDTYISKGRRYHLVQDAEELGGKKLHAGDAQYDKCKAVDKFTLVLEFKTAKDAKSFATEQNNKVFTKQ